MKSVKRDHRQYLLITRPGQLSSTRENYDFEKKEEEVASVNHDLYFWALIKVAGLAA
jgi:hypothetical protein